jgi:two-component system KDP operon response regulator KdpE
MGNPTPPRGSVLVVDDYEPFCEMLQTALELAGYATVTAANGSAALAAAAAAGGVDVALVDLGLPDRPGLEVAGELLHRSLAARCVLMSGLSPVEELAWPDDWAGERSVLLKPYTMSDLLEQVDAALAGVRSGASVGDTEQPSRVAGER